MAKPIVAEVIAKVDVSMLRRQRNTVLNAQEKVEKNSPQHTDFEGLLNLLDNFLDQAEDF